MEQNQKELVLETLWCRTLTSQNSLEVPMVKVMSDQKCLQSRGRRGSLGEDGRGTQPVACGSAGAAAGALSSSSAASEALGSISSGSDGVQGEGL